MIRRLFRWLGRKSIIFIALAAAMTAYVVWTSGDLPAIALQEQDFHLSQAGKLEGVVATLSKEREKAEAELARAGEEANRSSVAAIREQLRDASEERIALERAERSTADALLSAITLDTAAILDDRKRELRLAFTKRKIEGLEAALRVAEDYELRRESRRRTTSDQREQLQRGLEAASFRVQTARDAYLQAVRDCRTADRKHAGFQRRWWLHRQWGRVRGELDNLAADRDRKCALVQRRIAQLKREQRRLRSFQQRRAVVTGTVERAAEWVENELPLEISDIRERAEQERQNASRTVVAKATRFWERYGVGEILRWAAVALVIIIASPYLIRLFCYFMLAPAAMRRPAIRLQVPYGQGTTIPPSDRSTTSVAVRLEAGEELLVRQDYLQTSSVAGAKGTQWFLDWRAPLTSVASGLSFLTRIRGEGETTTISAVQDPFSEATILTLPDGAACVLKPRALAAVIQPTGRRLRVTTSWRLGSLNAWLTLQLRYVIFHGPARLIIKGGRGIRVERAERGRVFSQDQLVGFSADLTYSVTRTETFWPYFLGRAQLLKDRVDAGDGVLVIEEAPMAGRRAGQVRRGIEGMIDAGMKVFGM